MGVVELKFTNCQSKLLNKVSNSALENITNWLRYENEIQCIKHKVLNKSSHLLQLILFLQPRQNKMLFSFVLCIILIHPFISFHSILANASLRKDTMIENILSFLELNGKRHLAITSMEDSNEMNVMEFMYKLLEKSKLQNHVYSKLILTSSDDNERVSTITESLDFYKDSLLVIASPQNTSRWDDYLDLLTKTEVMSSTLILPEVLTSDQKKMIMSKLEKLAKSTFFYWAFPEDKHSGKIVWNRVITLVNVKQVVTNKLNFNQFGHIVEDYDMQGMHIMSTTVSWPPYIFLNEECKVQKKYNDKCKPYGFLVDALDAMAKMANFTWECHGDPLDNYGTTPLSGPANASGTWGGVVGDVVAGNYHFSMSTWVWKEERQDMFDFATIVADRTALAIRLKAKDIDYGLFTRPFRTEAWLLIGFAVILFYTVIIIPFLFAPNFAESTSYRLIEWVAFTFFMLTEIYYSGALTMFFSTAPPLPFETMKEVMSDYPTWKLMMRYGNDVYFVYKVQDGDPDYVAFWERVTSDPDESVFNSVGEGMDKVLNGFYVAQMQEGSIKGWIRDNPIEGEKVTIFGGGKATFYTLIVTNNSPLGRIFSFGTRQMIEMGVQDRISANWLERKKSSVIADLESTLIVLKPGQMIVMYFLVFVMMIGTLSVFVIEHIWRLVGGDRVQRIIRKKMENSEYLNLG